MDSKILPSQFSIFLLACLIFSLQSKAQTSQGEIFGSITDATGAVVARATVTALNLGTGVATTTTSGEEGQYLIQALPVGTYTVSVTMTGFKTSARTPVSVSTALTTSLDMTLELGAVTESITVTGDAPMLQTTNAQVSTVVSDREIFDLPVQLSGNTGGGSGRRQIDNFIQLTPGVTGSSFAKSFNGSATFMHEVIIDGGVSSAPTTSGWIGAFSPPYEAVEEFNVVNTMFPSEFGRGFAVMNFTMKSGSNQLHGNVFEFLRNDKFDARSFFSTVKPIVRQNEFGFTVGGPIVLPKIYSGKNKTFFFVAYTGFRLRGGAPGSQFVTLPTARMKRGDFSQLLPLGIQIFDPSTTMPDGSGGFVRAPFPGNVIPPADFDPIAQMLVADIPDPDMDQPFNNHLDRSFSPVNDDVWSFKIDHNISDIQKVQLSYWWDYQTRENHGPFSGPLDRRFNVGSPGGGVRLNHYYTFGPNLINHFVAGYTNNTRRWDSRTKRGNADLGIPNLANFEGFPCFDIMGIPRLGNACDTTFFAFLRTYQYADTLSWTKGKHQLKFGTDVQFAQQNTAPETAGGLFQFSNLETSQPNAPDVGAQGYGFASFLLGHADTAQVLGSVIRGWRVRYFSGFLQDTYRVSRKLTIQAGLSIQRPLPLRETYNRMSSLGLNTPNPGAGGIPGALTFAGTGPGRTGRSRFGDTHMELAPRLSLAYALNDKTVIRAGAGLYYTPSNGNTITGFSNAEYLNGLTFSHFLVSPDNGVTPATTLSQGFPAVTQTFPSLDPTLANGARPDYFNQDGGRSAVLHSWTFNIQRQLRGDFLLDVGYVGQRGTHLPGQLENLNQLHPMHLSLGGLLGFQINSPEAQSANIPIPYPGFAGTVAQALRPFPQFTDIRSTAQPTSSSEYHGLQMKVQRRFSRGLSFLGTYTLSKIIADSSQTPFAEFAPRPLDTYNRRLEKSIAPTDFTHNFVTSLIYELPFGPGKPFAGAGGVVGKIVGGWQINGIFQYTSAAPLGVSGGPSLPLFNGASRPNLVPGVPIRTNVSPGSFDPATDLFLNINAFAAPAPFTLGNVGPRLPNVRGFPFYNEALSVIKRTHITEAQHLEFRIEAFNAFNRVVFGNPATNINSPTFGQVTGQANRPRIIQFGLKYVF